MSSSATSLRLFTPDVVPAPAFPRWTWKAAAVTLLCSTVVQAIDHQSDLRVLLNLVSCGVGFRIGAWLDRLAWHRMARLKPGWRMIAATLMPFLGFVTMVVLGLLTIPFNGLDGAMFGSGAGPLADTWASVTVNASGWFIGASLGSGAIIFIDVVVSAVVKGFRARITLAVLATIGLMSFVLGAIATMTELTRELVRMLRAEEIPREDIKLQGVTYEQFITTVEWLDENFWAIQAGALGLALLIGFPSVLSACSKIADAVLERILPLVHAFDAVADGARDVRVEEAGSTELTNLAQHFNRMVERVFLGEKMERAFGVYVGDTLLDQIRAQHGEAALPAETKDATVFFADIRGFTTLSEQLPPATVTSVLNRYFDRVVAIIDEHQGYLDKFIGDAVVVVFNGPIDQADHAARGVRCAVALLDAVTEMNDAKAFPEVGHLAVGAGLNSGSMVCGNLGSSKQMEYTVIGDAVNLASRTEGLTKLYGARLLITQATVDRIEAELGPDHGFSLRRVDKVAAKGKAEPVLLWEVLDGQEPEARRRREETRDRFDEAFSAYLEGRFDQAVQGFDAVREIDPTDVAADLLRKRAHELTQAPPAAWDGVARMTSK